jgi:DNA repair protein RecN (Recombination protein N)
MLRELHISNFALIEDLTLSLDNNLTVLTGETGAGKSIIIGALNFVLGERADTQNIRTGCENASVDAVFYIEKNEKIKEFLIQLGIESEDNTLILRRNIHRTKGSRSYINDKPITLKVLKRVGDILFDIHGQHEHQNLLRKETHIDYLDCFLGLMDSRKILLSLLHEYHKINTVLEERKKRIKELKEKEELYRFQIKEIEESELKEGEDEELKKRQRILENAENLIQTIQQTYNTLYEDEGSVLESLNTVRSQIESLCKIDNSLTSGKEHLDNALFGIEESARLFSSYLNKMEYDPDELEIVTQRLDHINTLKMKYGKEINEIIRYKEEKSNEIKELETTEIKTEEIEKEIEEIRENLITTAYCLSDERLRRKKELEKRVNRELRELEMSSSSFIVDIKRNEEKKGILFPDGNEYRIGEKGIDTVTFLISTNPGEPPMDLRRIVSGGELSRIMLALKSILASGDDVHSMVFDEVDAGIGGAVAEVVGEKMKKISIERQVLTITHLHQIASKADYHIKVEKEERKGRAYTVVKVLDEKEKIKEIARLISGEKLTKTAVEHAKSILKTEKET